jgi:hypothetical protein
MEMLRSSRLTGQDAHLPCCLGVGKDALRLLGLGSSSPIQYLLFFFMKISFEKTLFIPAFCMEGFGVTTGFA